ncbi:SDR family NAD(P)-dependent oxidoreductase [Bacillus sp. MUM 13]|uniref:SDR family oxidoreductase n=1 Tax=Bacillus sp. MUM 13 TaxID=1678001 RepID=UPI0008F56F3D|nr:SDR family NAD(P)-dependent oxidoreductase [Bacillus sp. MUM 13]OIK04420.1 3-oxoacyl-[acyl-carrier-protein] reductase [Bacillus sp. MUM 13]
MGEIMKNKVALITGASSGIGRAAALKLAENGAKIILVDIKEDNAVEVKKEVEDLGAEAIIIEADVSVPEQMEHAFHRTNEEFGSIDFVFANAGINGVIAPIEDISADDFDTTIHTNLRGTFLTLKYAIPYMKEKGGSIAITSSINGNRTFRNFGFSAYSTSKAGQVAFGKMAALELAKYKIRVNIICPGAIDTNIDSNTFPEDENLKKIKIPIEYPEGSQPLENKSGTPEQVGDLVLFLASSMSSHITGTKVYIDGAESLL